MRVCDAAPWRPEPWVQLEVRTGPTAPQVLLPAPVNFCSLISVGHTKAPESEPEPRQLGATVVYWKKSKNEAKRVLMQQEGRRGG